MEIIKPAALGLCSRPIEYRKHFGLCITSMLHIPINQDKPTIWGEQSMWKFLAEQAPGVLIDEGVSKLKSEFLVHGFAYPHTGSKNASAVRVRLANKEKTLLAFGDRYWQGKQISEPREFSKLPVDWAHAYGGYDFPSNLLGKGRHPNDGIHVLPNFELPNQRLIEKNKEIPPASFGAIDIMHPQRVQYRGTYDADYLKNHAPGFPPDLDWLFFNQAPKDQWLDQPLRGNEKFAIYNMHPDIPVLEGSLPAYRSKIFVNYKLTGDKAKLKEVPMRLTTVWFFPDCERLILAYHGLAEVSTDDASDIISITAGLEHLSKPKPDSHYLNVLEKRADPKLGAVHSLRDSDLLPENVSTFDPDLEEAKKAFAMEGLQGEAQLRRAQIDVELAREQVRAMGKDPDALGIKVPVREKVPDGDQLAAYVEKKMQEAEKQQWLALDDMLKQLETAIEFAQKSNLNLADLQHRGPPKFRAEDFMKEMQSRGQLQGADAHTVYLKLVQKEMAEKNAYLQSAHMQPPAPAMLIAGAQDLRAAMQIASKKNIRFFANMDFTGADFSDLDLRKFDFSGAWLESVNFNRANLSGANLTGAVLAHANLEQAILIGTQLKSANLGRSKLARCVLDSADLTSAMLSHCSLASVQMSKATLKDAMILETTWGEMNATEVRATAQNFYKLDMKGVVFAEADLSGSNFIECDLRGVDFRGANICSATFVTCMLDKAQLQGALAKGAIFVKDCSLAAANLSHSNFTNANFGAAKMVGVQLIKAVLDGANLTEVDMSLADARLASAKAALCRRMIARNAKMAGINFQDAVLQHADLRSADLRSCSLFGADLSRVKLDGSVQLDNALLKRARTWPRLTPEQQAVAS